MKYLSYFLIFSILLLNSCKRGLEGKKSLVDLIFEPTGPNCPNGGYKLQSGVDQNGNNILEIDEVTSTKYICNGINGSNSLTSLVPEPVGSNCATGGYKINTGVDLNANGILEPNEIANAQYICNGLTGSNSLANVVEEQPGSRCPVGGYKVTTGTDINKNNILDALEVQNTAYVCNGKEGNNSLAALVQEPAGANCATGGYKINTGTDLNGNKILDQNEITSSQFICNGLTGNNSLVALVPEAASTNCVNAGYKVNSGVDINKNGNLDLAEIQNTSYICNGVNGLNYLIAVNPEIAGPNCSYGGYSFKTGIDANKNGVLENAEVTNTTFICNSSAVSEIRIPLDFSANTNSTQVVSGLALSNFNKANYTGLESIVFAARVYSGSTNNYATATLINSTDNTTIAGSAITSNQNLQQSYQYSGNLYNSFPNKAIDIFLGLSSQVQGSFSGIYSGPYLILTFKK